MQVTPRSEVDHRMLPLARLPKLTKPKPLQLNIFKPRYESVNLYTC
jgi:hypothetical protein